MAVYKDKNGTWYISTKVQGKQCTIRGFKSKREALICYDDEINKWRKNHGFYVSGKTLKDLCDDYYSYRQNVRAKYVLATYLCEACQSTY